MEQDVHGQMLRALVEGTPDEKAAARTHTDSCPVCQARLKWLFKTINKAGTRKKKPK